MGSSTTPEKKAKQSQSSSVKHSEYNSSGNGNKTHPENKVKLNTLHRSCADSGPAGNVVPKVKKRRIPSVQQARNDALNDDSESDSDRKKVKKALRTFRAIVNDLKQNSERSASARYSLAMATLRKQKGWVNVDKQVGHVPGVNIGDIFRCRAELRIIGLHGQFIRGIDYMNLVDGSIVATSIVDSGKYANITSQDDLTYCGEGENPLVSRNKHPKDQKLLRGNLALKTSMKWKTPVRVIHSIKDRKKRDSSPCYAYLGLYVVVHTWKQRGQYGRLVYKFRLKKITDNKLASEETTGEKGHEVNQGKCR